MRTPRDFKEIARQIVAEQRQISASAFTDRDNALVNRVAANIALKQVQKPDARLLAAFADVELAMLSAKRKKKKENKDKDADLPDDVYEFVSHLKTIMGSGGQAIAALRDRKKVGMSDEDAEEVADALKQAAETVQRVLKSVKGNG